MTDQPTTSVPAVHAPLGPGTERAEPSAPRPDTSLLEGKPLQQYFRWFTIASIAIATIWGSVGSILLPNQVQSLAFSRFFTGADATVDLTQLNTLKTAVASGTVATPDQQRLLNLLGQFDASRAQSLSIVGAIGVLGSMLAQPVVGVLSDRTRSRRGRRAPWILWGGIVGAVFLVVARFSPSVALLALFWTIAQVAANSALGPLNTSVADRVSESKRGVASALGGLGAILGGTAGGIFAGITFASLGLNIYFVIAALVAFGAAGFVLRATDRSSLDVQIPDHRWGEFFRGFLIPLRDRDFRWVWIARVVLGFGYAASGALSFFMLQSYIRPALSAAQATQIVPLLALAGLPGTLVALAFAGRLSDKLGRRKPFVIGASLLMALAMAVPLLWPALPALFIQAILAGIAFGIYLPVDGALFIDVLPDMNAAGRDLGVAALGTNLGQALGPIIAGQIIALTGSYRMIWAVAFILVLVAAGAIVPVKRAR